LSGSNSVVPEGSYRLVSWVVAEVEVDLKNEKELPLWEASWDDEDMGDFSAELKAELAKAAK
jgi:hypothetical protein